MSKPTCPHWSFHFLCTSPSICATYHPNTSALGPSVDNSFLFYLDYRRPKSKPLFYSATPTEQNQMSQELTHTHHQLFAYKNDKYHNPSLSLTIPQIRVINETSTTLSKWRKGIKSQNTEKMSAYECNQSDCNETTVKPIINQAILDSNVHCLNLMTEASNTKRSSLYSQLSFESIDSRIEVLDQSTLDEEVTRDSPVCTLDALPKPAQISLSPCRSPANQKNLSKAKSDTHLFFCVEDGLFSEVYGYKEEDICKYDNEDVIDCCESDKSAETTQLKRNSDNRRSFYAKFISKRHSTKAPSTNNLANTVKNKFKFRYSSKVPKLAQSAVDKKECRFPRHRGSEPSINFTDCNELTSKSNMASCTSLNMNYNCIKPVKYQSEESSEMDMNNAHSSLLNPLSLLTTNSGWKDFFLFIFLFLFISLYA